MFFYVPKILNFPFGLFYRKPLLGRCAAVIKICCVAN
jgi:hypothetical protein